MTNDAIAGRSPHSADEKKCHPEPAGAGERSAVSALSATEHTRSHNHHPLTQLRQFTPARIALARTGNSLPTKEFLEFSAAHAIARDAVHAPFDAQAIAKQLLASNFEYIQVFSCARDRAIYLRRPDLGRQLDDESREVLKAFRPEVGAKIVFIIADGLSAIAPQRYAVRVIEATSNLLQNWKIGPVIVAEQARVALGDEIGEILSAEITVMLIGERPGLSAADSLGIYLTYAPKPGRTDAERNCISNVREGGTRPEQAAQTLAYLLTSARRLKLSGVQLKDESAVGQGSRKLL